MGWGGEVDMERGSGGSTCVSQRGQRHRCGWLVEKLPTADENVNDQQKFGTARRGASELKPPTHQTHSTASYVGDGGKSGEQRG